MFNKTVVLLQLLSCLLFAQSQNEFKDVQLKALQSQKSEFENYQKETLDEFDNYKKALEKIYEEYKKELQSHWEDPELSSKKRWLLYSDDKRTRSKVDFEQEEITIQSIASSKEEAQKKIKEALVHVASVDTKSALESDPLEKRLKEVKEPSYIATSEAAAEPVLSNIIPGDGPPKDKALSYAKSKAVYEDIKEQDSKKVKEAKIYTLNIKLPADTTIKRSKTYYNDVRSQSQRQKVPLELVYAVMHTESSFNPLARSHVPAYGLMQIVPKSAGVDTYIFLYNQKKFPSADYLYNAKNNITMGSAYLHILYYKYLSNINDPQSRLYCTIAAYNTGAGNVARAFVGSNDTSRAAYIVNRMSPQEVYDRLLRDLKYDETKEYLKNVTLRIEIYKKLYS